MKLTTEQKAAHKAAFRAMTPADKLDYIVSSYKWPILLTVILLLILGSTAHRRLTEKEPVLYLALADVVAGEDLENALTAGFLRAEGLNLRRQEVYLYRDLYLSDCPLFLSAGFEGDVYAGVIANTPRPAEALRYLQYLSSAVRP